MQGVGEAPEGNCRQRPLKVRESGSIRTGWFVKVDV